MGGVDDDCVVHHGNHGDLNRSACGVDRDVKGWESQPKDCAEDDRFLCLEDYQWALRKAIEVLSGIVGSDARETLELCEKLEETQLFIAAASYGTV